MTHPRVILNQLPPLSSSTESEALRIGDPSPPVIPHLMRDPFGLDSRFHGNDGRGAGKTKKRHGNKKMS